MTESFFCPTRVFFGSESIVQVSSALEVLQIKKPFIVTGKASSLAQKSVAQVLEPTLPRAVLFSGVPAGPQSDLVDVAVDKFRSSGCDGVIGLGGGSALDVAKLVALIATNGGRCTDYESIREKVPNITRAAAPMIAIPTTSGTGSEVTPYSVISNSQTKRKFTVTHRYLFPTTAIVDPLLALSLPKDQTLATGLDAFVHSAEALLSTKQNEIIAPLAHRVLALIFKNLPQALASPTIENRIALSRAALLSGMVISHLRTGMIHTISAACDPYVELPHGLLNAIIMSYVLRFNNASYSGRLGQILRPSFNLKNESSDSDAASVLNQWLLNLGVPRGLKSQFLQHNLDEIIPKLITRIRQDTGLPEVNARSFSDSDLEKILDEILRN